MVKFIYFIFTKKIRYKNVKKHIGGFIPDVKLKIIDTHFKNISCQDFGM